MTSEYAETCRSIIILRLILSDDQRTNLFCVWFAIHGPIIKLRRKNNWNGNAFGRDNYEPFTSKETGKCPENACDLQCSKTTRIPLYEDQYPIDYWLLIVCVSHRKPKIRQTACRWFALRINFHFKKSLKANCSNTKQKVEDEALEISSSILALSNRWNAKFLPRCLRRFVNSFLLCLSGFQIQKSSLSAIWLAKNIKKSFWWKTVLWRSGKSRPTCLPELRSLHHQCSTSASF